MANRFTIKTPDFRAGLTTLARKDVEVQRRAARLGTDEMSRRAKTYIQADIRAAGLGNLANAVGQDSSLKRGSAGAFGIVIAKGKKSGRGAQALEAYSQGANIVPIGGRKWLAFNTPVIPTYVAGHKRMTPALYKSLGYEQRIGKLVFVPSRKTGNAVLIANNVSQHNRTGRIKSRNKGKSKVSSNVDSVVVFILIRFTVRAQSFSELNGAQRALDDTDEIYGPIFDRLLGV